MKILNIPMDTMIMNNNNLNVKILVNDEYAKTKKISNRIDMVEVPYNENYEIYIRNFKNKKGLVTVYIDGVNITENHKLIIYETGAIKLNRFIDFDNKFLFVKKTDHINKVRDESNYDSTIYVSIKYEKEKIYNNYNITRSMSNSGNNISKGITALGEQSNQKFNYVDSFEVDENSIELYKIYLTNKINNNNINYKIKICYICNTKNNLNSNFCTNCGLKLPILE